MGFRVRSSQWSISLLVMTVALAASISAQSPAKSAQSPAKDPAIVAVADAYSKASIAGDSNAIAALYTEDAVELPPNHPPVKGRAAIQAYYAELMGTAKMTAFTLTHWEARASGDVAYDVGGYAQTLSPKQGVAMKDTGKFSVILKKVGNEWKVAYAIYNSDQPAPPMATSKQD